MSVTRFVTFSGLLTFPDAPEAPGTPGYPLPQPPVGVWPPPPRPSNELPGGGHFGGGSIDNSLPEQPPMPGHPIVIVPPSLPGHPSHPIFLPSFPVHPIVLPPIGGGDCQPPVIWPPVRPNDPPRPTHPWIPSIDQPPAGVMPPTLPTHPWIPPSGTPEQLPGTSMNPVWITKGNAPGALTRLVWYSSAVGWVFVPVGAEVPLNGPVPPPPPTP